MNRNTHTRQPQSVPKVNKSNPLARGLIALVDGLSGRELIAGNFASFNNGSRAVGRAGRAIEYTTSQYVTYPFANRSRITNQLSIFSLTDYTAGGAPNGFLFGDTEAGAAGYNFGLYSNGSVWNSFVKTGGSGASASGGTFAQLQRFVHAASYDGANIRQYLNGLAAGVTAKTGNVDTGAFSLNINRWNASNVHAGRFYIGAVWNRVLTPAEHASLAANPWQLFEPIRRQIVVSGSISVYRPGSDIIVNGWTAVGAASLNAAMSDVSRSNYALSPNLSTPTTQGWDNPLPVGTWDISLDSARVGTSGQARVVCLDAGGVSVGGTAWQTLTATDTVYTLSVTTSAISTQFRIEVQP